MLDDVAMNATARSRFTGDEIVNSYNSFFSAIASAKECARGLVSSINRRRFLKNDPFPESMTDEVNSIWHNNVSALFCKWWAFGFSRRLTAILPVLLLIASSLNAAIPPIRTYDSEVRDWVKVRLVATTNTLSSLDYAVTTDLVTFMKSRGLRRLVKRMQVYPPSGNLQVMRKPTLADTALTITTNDLINAFVSGDYTTNGLVGDTSTKYIQTDFFWGAFTGITSIHLGAYSRTSGASNANYMLMGMSDGTLGPTHLIVSAANLTYIQLGTPSFNTATDTDGLGFSLHTRTALNNAVEYKNGITLTNDAGTQLTNIPSETLFIHCRDADNAPNTFSDRQLCFYTAGLGMSDANALAYYRAVQFAQRRWRRGL
jgi:hypothetical protein